MNSLSTPRLFAFAAVVLALGLLPYFHFDHSQTAVLRGSLPQAATLLPENVGTFKSVDRWAFPLSGYTGMEQGATYLGTASPQKLQYDMWLGKLGSDHNGIACYLAQGSQVIWQKSQTIETSDSQAVFGVALLRDDAAAGPTLKMVAATECSLGACQENALVAHGWDFSGQTLVGLFKPKGILLPLSVTLAGPENATGPAQLQQLLNAFLHQLALRPVRAFSALESGLAR